ncbi:MULTISPECIES: hypothetical protein [Streptomyces]|uniref:Uncharacterized protein n=1 Tax=Streptomyces parvulus TaxID=146923 RepID=A0A369V8I6_9ACTN|nr:MULTISPECIES: hypothetical protein [Streptomyces]MCM1973754.1 hypothetical protein [Streptomyces sp. G1]RDD89101.1 hypothetical protein DVZ84_08825 [Streptomyces parvulus]
MTTEPALSFRAVPGPAFAAGCTVSTWLDVGGLSTPVGYVLIGHAPPWRPRESAESIEAGLMGMVDAMRLQPAAARVPIVGARLLIRERFAALDYGHPTFVMRLPAPGADWRRHVLAGGPVCLTIGLDPLPPGAGPDAIGAYLDRVAATNRAYMGATTRRVR